MAGSLRKGYNLVAGAGPKRPKAFLTAVKIFGSHFLRGYRIRLILGALFAAVVADGLITRFLIHNGLAREANPFLVYWVRGDELLILKLVGGFLAVLYLFFIYRRHPTLAMVTSTFFLAAYTIIIFWNLLLLK